MTYSVWELMEQELDLLPAEQIKLTKVKEVPSSSYTPPWVILSPGVIITWLGVTRMMDHTNLCNVLSSNNS